MTIHNLDEGIQEYFEFIVKGHTYRFRQLNTEEIEDIAKVDFEKEDARKYLYRFISKVDPKSPDFEAIANKMIAPQWVKFQEMIKVEMGLDGNNTGTKTS